MRTFGGRQTKAHASPENNEGSEGVNHVERDYNASWVQTSVWEGHGDGEWILVYLPDKINQCMWCWVQIDLHTASKPRPCHLNDKNDEEMGGWPEQVRFTQQKKEERTYLPIEETAQTQQGRPATCRLKGPRGAGSSSWVQNELLLLPRAWASVLAGRGIGNGWTGAVLVSTSQRERPGGRIGLWEPTCQFVHQLARVNHGDDFMNQWTVVSSFWKLIGTRLVAYKKSYQRLYQYVWSKTKTMNLLTHLQEWRHCFKRFHPNSSKRNRANQSPWGQFPGTCLDKS